MKDIEPQKRQKKDKRFLHMILWIKNRVQKSFVLLLSLLWWRTISQT